MTWRYLLFLFSLAYQQTALGEYITLQIGDHVVRATIASTPHSREHGLMNNTHLCENCGMLFVFPKPDQYSFWMKNTPLSLSIAFIDAKGRIIEITEMLKNTNQIHSSQGTTLYALEMNKYWFAQHSIKPQMQVQGLQQAPRGE